VLVSGALAQEKKTGLPAGVTVNRDQVYAQRGERPLKLDLYRARDAEGRLPVVLWVHGGGWNQGSKDRCPAAWLAQKGFAVASVEYRLSTEARWPAQMEDCRDAVRWLRDHAAELGFDADHIGVWGGSAGGHLVALMGTLPLPEGEKTSARVQAVCDWYGPSDLLTMPPNVVSEKRSREQVEKSNGAILLGAPIMDVPELAKRCSAFHQVSAGDAPFLIMHGEKDPMVPLEQSEKLDAALRGAGVESELVIIPEGGHGGAAFQTDAVREKVQRFFDKHLRPGRDKAAPKS
ncbi:MAG: alpha/beta hydrolase, partial [Verrucomicrobiales bacterium]|nr:alpha/beta hydrolase [Verrucomicrobiales bacterium]